MGLELGEEWRAPPTAPRVANKACRSPLPLIPLTALQSPAPAQLASPSSSSLRVGRGQQADFWAGRMLGSVFPPAPAPSFSLPEPGCRQRLALSVPLGLSTGSYSPALASASPSCSLGCWPVGDGVMQKPADG